MRQKNTPKSSKVYRGVSEARIQPSQKALLDKAERKQKYFSRLNQMKFMLSIDWDKNFGTIYEFSKTDEDCHQAMLIQWFKVKHPDILVFAIPNGSNKSKAQRYLFQCTGVLSGVADIFVAQPVDLYGGLFLELKTPENRQSKNQKDFEVKSREKGYMYQVSNDLKKSIEIVETYLGV